jgi:cytoskeletal protein CcmA (bactofilin family)
MSRAARAGIATATAALLVAFAATVVLAQDELLGGKLRTGDNLSIGAGETIDGDLYLFAGTATVDGTVDGDLTVLGGQVTLNGTVTGDLLAAGGTVIIGGSVEGDVRTSGGQVNLRGETGEDVLAAGGQLTLDGGATVGGDLIVAGGQVAVAGSVAGSIEGAAGTYSRTGSVGGTEHVVVEEQRDEPDAAAEATSEFFDALRHFVVLLILGALILWLVPRFLGSADATLRSRPGFSLLWGAITVVGYVVFVICALIVMILLAILFGLLNVGALVFIDVVAGLLAISAVSFGFVLAVGFIADLVVGFALARLVARQPAAAWWQQFGILAAGAAAVVIVTSLPIVGGIAKLAVALFGLGAMVLLAWTAWRPPSAASAPPSGWGQAQPPPTEPAA